uniref:Transcription initiation factor TFIID subunit 8 n=1 Tax=Panagrellus redivivus TaxID=6233 RepID=A0A7E4ZRT8_PANRE
MTICSTPLIRIDVEKGKEPAVAINKERFEEARLAVEEYGYDSKEAHKILRECLAYIADALGRVMGTAITHTRLVRYADSERSRLPEKIKPKKSKGRRQRCFAGLTNTLYKFDLPLTPVPPGVTFLQYHTYMDCRPMTRIKPRRQPIRPKNDDKPKPDDDNILLLAPSDEHEMEIDEAGPQGIPQGGPQHEMPSNSNNPGNDDNPRADDNATQIDEPTLTSIHRCMLAALEGEAPRVVPQYQPENDFKDDSSSSVDTDKENDDNMEM